MTDYQAYEAIKHCPDRDFLIDFKVPQKLMQYQGRKVENIGQLIYSTLLTEKKPYTA